MWTDQGGLLGTFIETSMPVVDHYRKEGKVIDVSCATCTDLLDEMPLLMKCIH
jgi:hypothetical protein